jgi:16S rRNA (adenine1518-N6/adenine1519-N6)-dimethyltransferase
MFVTKKLFNIKDKHEKLPKLKFSYKKSMGQNFIFDLDLCYKIVSHLSFAFNGTIVEIGSGLGSLTRVILLRSSGKVVSIEKDQNCLNSLYFLSDIFDDRLKILKLDALNLNFTDIAKPPYRIISNLPYNISIILLLQWLNNISLFESFTLMFQKEVADRLLSTPYSKNYGRTTVLLQLLCHVEHVMDIPSNCFTPVPKIDSSLLYIRPKKSFVLSKAETKLFTDRLLKIIFNHRRKMLRVSLRSIFPNINELLDKSRINRTSRVDEITIEQFITLADILCIINI